MTINQTAWMTEAEQQAIIGTLSKQDIMLEWGSGGSTLQFSPYVRYYYSIEHVELYAQETRKQLGEQKKLNTRVFYVPPVEGSQYEGYEEYVRLARNIGFNFSRVLIDGRQRVACAVNIIPYLQQHALVFVHDWDREKYHSIQEYYTLVNCVEQVATLRINDA